ncbi:MAG: 4a-hydroxytetrahydrobiopterin dehydratase [Patescibacteria group bacterium]
MQDLANKKCAPCTGGLPPLAVEEVARLGKEVPKWEAINGHHLKRRFKFKNFAEALAFVNKVGALAESEGHHPDIRFGWGYVEITTFTHSIGVLSENDFILAAKVDTLIS